MGGLAPGVGALAPGVGGLAPGVGAIPGEEEEGMWWLVREQVWAQERYEEDLSGLHQLMVTLWGMPTR